METIEIMCLCLLNMFSFVLGARVGQKAAKGEEIKNPSIPNPIKVHEEYQKSKENKEKQERLNTMMENINNYRPDGIGQKDID